MHFLRQVYVNCDVCLKIFDLDNLFMEPRHFLDVTGHGSRVAAHDPLVSLLACLRVCLSPLHSIIRPQAVNENKVLDTRQSSTL